MPSSAPTATEASSTTISVPAIPGSGDAWLDIVGRGLVHAHAGALEVVASTPSVNLAEGADKKVYAEVSGQLRRIEHGALVEMPGEVRGTWAVGPSGDVWTHDPEHEETLVHNGKPIARPSGWAPSSFGVESSGRVIAVTAGGLDALEAFDHGAWTKLAPLPDRAYFTAFGVSRGKVYIGTSLGLYRVVGKGYEQVQGPPSKDTDALTVRRVGSSEGSAVAYAIARNRVVRADEAGSFVVWDLAGDVGGEDVKTLSVDARGRVWAGTASRLVVVGPSADEKIVIPSGTHDALAGEIDSLIVTGDGPALPPSTALLSQSVKGVFVRGDGSPLADTALDLCPSFDAYADSFCSTAPFQAHTRTARDGSYVFEGVPLGSYEINIRNEDFRLIAFGVVGMRADRPYDLGVQKIYPPRERR